MNAIGIGLLALALTWVLYTLLRLIEPFWPRLVAFGRHLNAWLVAHIAWQATRHLPGQYIQWMRRQLLQAGLYGRAQQQIAFSLPVMLGIAGFIGGWFITGHVTGAASAAFSLGVIPVWVLCRMGIKRREAIERGLSVNLDTLCASVEAGLGLDAALTRLGAQSSPITRVIDAEWSRYLTEVRMGVARVDALKRMGDRSGSLELKRVVNALVQGERLGIGMAQVLKAQSQHVRATRFQRAEKQALKAPVKIVLPLVLFIFPSLFIVMLGPAALRIHDQFFAPSSLTTQPGN